MGEYCRDSCIHGYHVYKDALGEILECVREPSNHKDRYAVAVLKDGNIVGHLPKKISFVCSLFVRRGGTIHCTVTENRRYSAEWPRRLEIPCTYSSMEKRSILKRYENASKTDSN